LFVFIKCIFKRCGKRPTKGLLFHLFLKLLLIDHIFSHNVHVSHVYLCSMYLESWNNVVKTIIKLCTKGWCHYHYFMITSKHIIKQNINWSNQNFLPFQSFDYESTWWRLFQLCVEIFMFLFLCGIHINLI
jgi:hypothetical protein